MASQNTLISLSEVWTNTLAMWSGSATTDPTNDINMEDQFNMVGAQASVPDVTQFNIEANYSASLLYGLQWNSSATIPNTNTGFSRIMGIDSVEGDLSNTYFCYYAGNYSATSFMSDTAVYKNAALAGTISNARDTLSLSSLVIGDVIHADKPISFCHSTYPGSSGAYGGYAGYCFATRSDRYSPTIYIQNLDGANIADIEVLYTTTSDSNVTTMTSGVGGQIAVLGYAEVNLTTTRNYYIVSNRLICCHRGEAPSKDVSVMYPLTMEHKYGWFSSDGHSFAVNNAQVGREDSGGGWEIDGMATDGVSAMSTQVNSGRDNIYVSDGANANLKGGNYFSGDACVIYPDSGQRADGAGTLFGAESQADGNGGCGTFFTAYPAHARATVSGGSAAWVAFVSSGYSGSTPSYPLYADVVMRFDSDGVFISAEDFYTGTTGPPPISKAYFGNGAGSGTYADAGDWFYSSCPVQGFSDTDATDKDETNMIMSNHIDLPERNEFTLWGSEGYGGYEMCEEACIPNAEFSVHSPSSGMTSGIVLFSDAHGGNDYDFPFNGQQMYFGWTDGEMWYCVLVDYNGVVLSVDPCEG